MNRLRMMAVSLMLQTDMLKRRAVDFDEAVPVEIEDVKKRPAHRNGHRKKHWEK